MTTEEQCRRALQESLDRDEGRDQGQEAQYDE